ncbi:dol-P-Man:Man(5)GlcNAc(2)-PP-Dol alpha-1,3-mannosyltransferase-like [Mytilus galloprovincialis]|uniref:dol-P-Man:Man(5)GlcNAc(2)-PP-Dol alpha-1,3-mannosyltransferase-like n=1 Tax=Mytilus galloprovincialis TaxID=29158 RepID=UPI003F7B4ACD
MWEKKMAASTKSKWKRLKESLSPKLYMKYAFHPEYCLPAMILLIVAEISVNLIVIQKIKYTEIDWTAYMQEVEGVVNGTYDYLKLKGDTGPLVYPAGFVYIYTALYYITDHGTNIKLGQYIFAVLYILSLVVIFDIYRRCKTIPPYAYIFMCCASYRIHSIYILRLFNDPIAMLFLYIAVNLFLQDKWSTGCLMFSLGVSVKMNVLLFAPALLVLLLVRHGTMATAKYLTICALPQIILAIPFLLVNPWGYIIQSFNLGRQFFYIWTVNWRLVPEDLFLDEKFQLLLLACHAVCLLLFFHFKWKRLYQCVRFRVWMKPLPHTLTSSQIILPLFTANFIGMCFSRSLHYQFYVWYFHTLHYILWSTALPSVVRILLLGCIELSWNTYPSTVFSSSLLHGSHFIILTSLWWSPLYTPQKKVMVASKMH